MGWNEVGEWIGGLSHWMQKTTQDGLVDKIAVLFMDMAIFVLFVVSYFN